MGLANSTIMQVTASNDQRIDEYFEVLTNCLDEKTFIRDYEKTYPFKQDVNSMLSRGVFMQVKKYIIHEAYQIIILY